MRNTIIVSVLLFIAVIVASVFYFGGLDSEKKEAVKPIAFLPSDTYLVASFVNDETTDNIFKDFEIFQAILGKQDLEQLNLLKQQLLRNKNLSTYLGGSDIFISLHPGKDQTEMLFSIPVVEEPEKEAMDQLLGQLSSQFKFGKSDSLGHTIYSFQQILKDSTQSKISDSSFYMSYQSNIFFASYNKELLLKVLDKKQEKLKESQITYFNEHSNRNSPFTVYIPQQNLPAFFAAFKRNKAGDFLRQFIQLKGQTVWNINYKQDALMLSGESELEDKDSQYIALFANQRKTVQRLYNYFPSNTMMFVEYSFSDVNSWFSDLAKWQQDQDGAKQLSDQEAEIAKDSPNLLADFKSVIAGDFAVLEQSNSDYLGFIAIKDSSKLEQILPELAETVGDSIYRFRHASMPYRYFGDGLKVFSRPYFVRVSDLIVLANQQSTLQEYLRTWKRKDLLIGGIGFKNYEQIQGNEANVTFFLNTKNASNFLINNLTNTYSRNFRNKEDYGYQEFYSWSLQLSGNAGNFISRLYGIYKSKNRLGVNADWTYSMGSRLISGPYVFEHSDTSQFILAQEQDHTVHAIHPSGNKLWSTVFSGRIVEKTIQLEDRSLVLVTDRRRLYRFDPHGKMMAGFSTSVSEEPIFAPTYVDWGNQKMLIIPGKNKLMAYDLEGGAVVGWDNVTVEGNLMGPAQFVDNQVVVATSYGRVYFFDMGGNKTQEIDVPGDVNFISNLGVVQRENGYVFYAADEDGKVYEMNKQGDSKVVYEGKWDAKYQAEFENIAGTTAPEMIVLDGSVLQVLELGNTVKPLFDHTFTKKIENKPYYFPAGSGLLKMGIAPQGTNLIYLFTENGGIADGYPVEAQPLFYDGKINYNSGNYLICTRRDWKLYAFRH